MVQAGSASPNAPYRSRPDILCVDLEDVSIAPMFAVLLRRFLAEWRFVAQVSSAGTQASPNQPANIFVNEALARYHLYLTGHQSRPLEELDLSNTRFVFVTRPDMKEVVACRGASRVIILDVPDPIKGTKNGHIYCAAQLVEKLHDVVLDALTTT